MTPKNPGFWRQLWAALGREAFGPYPMDPERFEQFISGPVFRAADREERVRLLAENFTVYTWEHE